MAAFRSLLIALLALVPMGLGSAALAQTAVPIIVSACGTPVYTFTATRPGQPTEDTTGKLCTNTTASLSGTTSNASSGVATSSTNVPTVSYGYGFNGTTWDQLQVDGSKYLKVDVAAGGGTSANIGATGSAVPASANLIGGGAAGGAGNLTGATVKAASTAPVATDTALVVTESQNSPLYTAAIAAIPLNSSGSQVGAVGCDTHTYQHITSATDTLLVQGVTAKIVKVCGAKFNFSGSAAQSAYLENTASTNANCSSTKTQIAGLVTGNATTPSSDGFYNSIWGGLANTSANGLCVNTSGTGGVDVDLWFTQGS